MTKEQEKEVQKWNDYIHRSVIDMFKQDGEVLPHALIFTDNNELEKQKEKGHAQSARDLGELSEEQIAQIDAADSSYGFMHMALDKFMENDAGKDMAAIAIQKIIKETKALAYAFISEAWMNKLGPIKAEDYNPKKHSRPSELPDDQRSEIIMVHIESKDHIDFRTYEIVRDDAEPWLYFREEMSFKSKTGDNSNKYSQGRFAGFLNSDSKSSELSKVAEEAGMDGGILSTSTEPRKTDKSNMTSFSLTWDAENGFQSSGDENVSDSFEAKFKEGSLRIIHEQLGDEDLSTLSSKERDDLISAHADVIISKMKLLFEQLKKQEKHGNK